MYKNILVPVALDHNAHLSDAMNIAAALRREGGQVTLLHVMEAVPGYVASYISDEIQEQNIRQAHDALNEMANEAHLDANTKIITGHAGRAILDYGNETGCDLIIIASHRPGLQDYFLGSTATHVVRHAVSAVHVIR